MKMQNKKHLFILSLTLLLFGGCKKENRCDCIKRTGTIITDTRSVPFFDKITAEGNVKVYITQDSIQEVKVQAGEHLISLIETEVVDGTLFIRNKNRCNWTRSYKNPLNVYITLPKLKYLTSDGTGDITSLNTLTTDTMDVQTKNSGNIELTINNSEIRTHMHGGGDVTLHGSTQEHDISIGGTAYLYCQDLHTSYTYLHAFTIGLCYVNVTNLFICQLDDIGDVYCYGNPSDIQKTVDGKGKIYFK
jgi:hypothetical protein